LDRGEFIIATALVLFVAFLAGWTVSWLVHRLTQGRAADLGELDRLAGELRDAETQRDEAVTYLHAREAELLRELAQARAELAAAMDGLRAARAETEDLRAWIDKVTETDGHGRQA
jgi:prophage endopeptidase